MHQSAMRFGRLFFDIYCADVKEGVVVDIGSQDVNGSLKQVCPPGLKYVGVDYVAGNNVDIVLDDPYRLPLDDGSVDAVVCSSCFEHSELFWLLFLEILRILKPGGLFYLNVPSNGLFHRYPVDCWRFYPDSGRALVTWAARNGLAIQLLESFVGRQSPVAEGWNDFIAVFQKGGRGPASYPKRMAEHCADVFNVYSAAATELQNEQRYSEDQIRIFELHSKLRRSEAEIATLNRQIHDLVTGGTRHKIVASLRIFRKVAQKVTEKLKRPGARPA
jgi:SAM-dependent methyltransferase